MAELGLTAWIVGLALAGGLRRVRFIRGLLLLNAALLDQGIDLLVQLNWRPVLLLVRGVEPLSLGRA